MYFDQVEQYITRRMEQELSPGLCYHKLGHTRDEVVPAAKRLARMEGIQGAALTLLLTAAWFHDIGYVVRPLHHELISTRIAQEVLPAFDYTAKQIDVVSWAILATALPQAPRNHLERVLVDADLDVLGRDNFMARNQDLRRELAFLGKEYSDEHWYANQIKFIENHQYFTVAAHTLRDAQKAINLAALKKAQGK
jgi:uncharacterized protein